MPNCMMTVNNEWLECGKKRKKIALKCNTGAFLRASEKTTDPTRDSRSPCQSQTLELRNTYTGGC